VRSAEREGKRLEGEARSFAMHPFRSFYIFAHRTPHTALYFKIGSRCPDASVHELSRFEEQAAAVVAEQAMNFGLVRDRL
jgi:hypothetical protein